ncbi:hypothetical protein M0805_008974 [Coniferiporia weirii]|nr:hypothetical protein M0805_008974 [Coniferiporia weirii]
MSADVSLSEGHPLALELSSLHQAITHYQLEAHRAAVQLQHHSLETSTALQRLHALERENSQLRTELDIHRAHADVGSGGSLRDALQVQELSLSLRRLSDKLDLTEKALLARNEELISAERERDSSKNAEENALEVVVRLRMELETSHAEKRELLNRVKAAEEQRKMSDLVVEEYANLVRSLEGRPSLNSRGITNNIGIGSRSSLDGLNHARQGLQKLLQDSNSDSEKLHAEIGRLHDALEMAQASLQAGRTTAQHDKRQLAVAQSELHQLKTDDNAAAKMVSRYMKFSQSSADVLHNAIEKLKSRHAATVSTYESRLAQMENRLASEMRQSERFHRALDELTEDISREAYGRRREISLRLAILGREESLSERLKRWLIRARELLQKARLLEDERQSCATFEEILEVGEDILAAVDGPTVLNGDSLGSVARVLAAEATVSGLRKELQGETDRRLFLQRQRVISRTSDTQTTTQTPKSDGFGSSRYAQPPIPPSLHNTSGTSDPSDTVLADSVDEATQPICQETQSPKSPIPALSIPNVSDNPSEFPDHPALRQINLQRPVPENLNGASDSIVFSDSALILTHTPKFASPPSKPSPHLKVDLVFTLPDTPQPKTPENRTQDPPEGPGSMDFGSHPTSISHPDETNLSDNYLETQHPVHADPEMPQFEEPTLPLTTDLSMIPASNSLADDPSFTTCSQSLNGDSHTLFPTETQHSIPHSTGLEPASPVQLDTMTQEQRYKNHATSPPIASGALNENDLFDNTFEDRLSPSGMGFDISSLMPGLAGTEERYKDIQHQLRDCHLALQQLKQSLGGVSSSSSTLRAAVERLDDYCEDARVELEIRVADEERITKGYQTLLSVPGALSDEVSENEIKSQIEAFVDGSDPAVHRVHEMMRRKLDDLQHDIAVIKLVMYESPSPSPGSQDIQNHSTESLKASASSWTSWTGTFLSSSRSPSPAPSFGAVMTSPRLRHSNSSQRVRVDSNNTQSPFAGLGLRIPMPSQVPSHASLTLPSLSHTQGSPKPRVASNMFSLGIRGGGLLQSGRKSSFAFTHEKAFRQSETAEDSRELDTDVD